MNWGDLLHSLSVIPSGLHHSPPSCPLLPLLFSSSFHQTLAPLSHLHSLNQLLSTHPCDPILFHPITLPPSPPTHPSLCLSHLPQLPSDHSASMNRWPTWSNLTLWLTELQCPKWGYRPHALSLSITVSSHAKSCSPLPFVSGVSDRRREQIRHQKTRYRGSIHFPRLSFHRLCNGCDRWSASNCECGPQRGH